MLAAVLLAGTAVAEQDPYITVSNPGLPDQDQNGAAIVAYDADGNEISVPYYDNVGSNGTTIFTGDPGEESLRWLGPGGYGPVLASEFAPPSGPNDCNPEQGLPFFTLPAGVTSDPQDACWIITADPGSTAGPWGFTFPASITVDGQLEVLDHFTASNAVTAGHCGTGEVGLNNAIQFTDDGYSIGQGVEYVIWTDVSSNPMVGMNATIEAHYALASADTSPPIVSVSSPTGGLRCRTVPEGSALPVVFECTPPASLTPPTPDNNPIGGGFASPNPGPGIASCTAVESYGSTVATVGLGAQLDTTTPGLHTVTVTGVDTAGNQASRQDTYTVTGPPTLSATHTADGNQGWNVSSPVTETVTATDNSGTGLASGSPSCTVDGNAATLTAGADAGTWTFPVTGDGPHSVSCSASDNAGDPATTATDTVNIDTTPPSLSATHTVDGKHGWNVSSPVVETVSAADSGSGLASGSPSCTVDGTAATLTPTGSGTWTFPVTGDGPHSVSCSASDTAGNQSTATDSVQIDTTPPSLSASHTVDGKHGWNVSSPVTETVTAADSGSGFSSLSCTLDNTGVPLQPDWPGTWFFQITGQGPHAVSCTASDIAGNQTTASDPVKIDTAAPTVTYSGNAGTYALTATVNITCTPSDPTPGSGLASSTCQNITGPAYTFTPGVNTYSATATDNAGNTGNGTTTFTVAATPAGVCQLTTQFIEQSAKYKALPLVLQSIAGQLSAAACNAVLGITPKLPPAQAKLLIAAYTKAVAALVAQGWITTAQSQTLSKFANTL